MALPWHSGDNLQKALTAFHLKSASYPRDEIAAAQRDFIQTMDTVRGELQRTGIAARVEYTGSSYEGIKVPSTTVEFDVMVVIAQGKHVTVENLREKPLYACLSTSFPGEPLSKMVDPNTKYLIPDAAAAYFKGKLQLIINSRNLNSVIKLRQHGPAVQMDVAKGGLFYSVDMVPTFQVGNHYYVAKPFKEEKPEEGSAERLMTWRKSYSLDEKERIKRIDGTDGMNQCRKQCMRMLKVLRDKEAGLSCMNSYIIKTAVLLLCEEVADWSQKYMGQRFIDILRYLAAAFDRGVLPHFYERHVNLLIGWTPIQRQNVAYRLKELVRSEQSFYAALA